MEQPEEAKREGSKEAQIYEFLQGLSAPVVDKSERDMTFALAGNWKGESVVAAFNHDGENYIVETKKDGLRQMQVNEVTLTPRELDVLCAGWIQYSAACYTVQEIIARHD